MVVRKPTYKKWWLDFQGVSQRPLFKTHTGSPLKSVEYKSLSTYNKNMCFIQNHLTKDLWIFLDSKGMCILCTSHFFG